MTVSPEIAAVIGASATMLCTIANNWLKARGSAKEHLDADQQERQLTLATIKQYVDELKSQLADLKAEQVDARQREADLRQRVAALEEENRQLRRSHQQELDGRDSERRDMLAKLAAAERQAQHINALELELASCQSELARERAEKALLCGEVDRLQKALEDKP